MNDWICTRHRCWRGDRHGLPAVTRLLDAAKGVTRRVAVQRWVRYRIDLANVQPKPDDITLTRLSPQVVEALRRHPDHAQEAFASGLAFWDLGLRDGFVWMEDNEPLCFQWLLEAGDAATLRARSHWANMYPPLDPGTGQVEKLWTFSTARQRGIASRFCLAMFAEARLRGLRTLVTHIHEANEAARSWAVRTGWSPYGAIVRYEFDVPVVRNFNMSVCAHQSDEGVTSAH